LDKIFKQKIEGLKKKKLKVELLHDYLLSGLLMKVRFVFSNKPRGLEAGDVKVNAAHYAPSDHQE
jgi:hypothetical protein